MPAEPDDRFASGEAGPGDGQIGEAGGDGHEVVAAGSMAPLTADAAVTLHRSGIGPGGAGAVV